MTTPTVAWNESDPVLSDPFSQGDNRIREMKTQVREILSVDHVMSSSGSGGTWGYHNKVTLKQQSSYPTKTTGVIHFFTYEKNSKAELHCKDDNDTVQQLTSGGVFIGGMTGEIRMWSGTLANIPTGWELCDSGSGVNLIGKFIRGVSTSTTNPGSTGGSDTTTLTTAELPAHTHTASGGTHSHDVSYRSGASTGVLYSAYTYGNASATATWQSGHISSGSAHNHTLNNTGSGTAFDNRPAYYELAFIKRS